MALHSAGMMTKGSIHTGILSLILLTLFYWILLFYYTVSILSRALGDNLSDLKLDVVVLFLKSFISFLFIKNE